MPLEYCIRGLYRGAHYNSDGKKDGNQCMPNKPLIIIAGGRSGVHSNYLARAHAIALLVALAFSFPL